MEKIDIIRMLWRHYLQWKKRISKKYRFFAIHEAKKEFRKRYFPMPSELGKCGSNTIIEYPCWFDTKSNVFLDENVRVRSLCQIINSASERVFIKKYSVLAANCTIITNNHKSTVGIPQIILGPSHINDKCGDVIIDEDVWIGANVTILPGVHIGRGAIISAGSIVTKSIPPYSVAAGIPAHVIKKKFDLEQVVEHEKVLYPKKERLSKELLVKIYADNFSNMSTYGTSIINDDNAGQKIENAKRLVKYIEPVI